MADGEDHLLRWKEDPVQMKWKRHLEEREGRRMGHGTDHQTQDRVMIERWDRGLVVDDLTYCSDEE